MKKIIVNVKSMHCKSCEMLIKESLEESDGVKNVEVSHEKGTAKVVFDESKINEEKIKRIINNEGYEVG